MSARSPRGSLSGASSDEVAEDFAESLKELQTNDRIHISNLTSIAKEYTEHAQAISRVLEHHINTVAPTKKLPALYLLDSIVKNVGTPYTVYLGRNLFSTFMSAYRLVDKPTRRSMEGMLKTWKEPIPGSLDTKPVFDRELWRPIENALIQHKTLDLQGSRQVQTQPQAGYRSTPTPPQNNPQFVPPSLGQTQAQPYYAYGVHQPTPLHQHVSSNLTPVPSHQQPQPQYPHAIAESRPVNVDELELESIKRDLAALITVRQGQLAANPYNQDLQHFTQTLRHLQDYLNSPHSRAQINPQTLQQIRAQVTDLASRGPPQAQPQPSPVPVPQQNQWQVPAIQQQPAHVVRPPVPYSQPLSAQTPPSLNPSLLSGLQSILANGQKPSTPQMRAAAPELQNASHAQLNTIQNQAASTPALNNADLIAALTKSGLLSNLPSANPTLAAVPTVPSAAPPAQQTTAQLLQSLQGILPTITSQTGTPTQSHAQLPASTTATGKPRIPISAAALKTFRPELVHTLYDAQPNQCSTCGRRFLANDEGRAKKARHLDWHFRTNQRMADASIARGAHRDWFVNEFEWISLVDFDPSTATADQTANAGKVEVKKGPKDQWVRAPPGVTKNVCSIDFEEMRANYSEELQEWVFMNATMYQGKIVHATCLAELQKGQQQSVSSSLAAALSGAGSRQRSATPDSSLGKRKADGLLASSSARMRVD